MDTLIIVTVIIICTYLIIRAAKKQNPKIHGGKIEEKINSLKIQTDKYRDIVMRPGIVQNKTIEGIKNDLIKIEEKYNRLVKNENDLEKIAELTEDLGNYFIALARLENVEYKLAVDMSNETAEHYGELTAEPEAKKQELEKKFNELLKNNK